MSAVLVHSLLKQFSHLLKSDMAQQTVSNTWKKRTGVLCKCSSTAEAGLTQRYSRGLEAYHELSGLFSSSHSETCPWWPPRGETRNGRHVQVTARQRWPLRQVSPYLRTNFPISSAIFQALLPPLTLLIASSVSTTGLWAAILKPILLNGQGLTGFSIRAKGLSHSA